MKIKKQIEQIEGVELVEKADKGVLLVYLKQKLSNKDLLEIAKEKYPVGTKFIDMEDGAIRTVANQDFQVADHEVNTETPENEWSNWTNPFLFLHGQWAEIVQPLFKTEDGVDVYVGDAFYVVKTDTSRFLYHSGSPSCIIFVASEKSPASLNNELYFSSKENAQAYIDTHKSLELVEGEIYTSKEYDDTWIFRFESIHPDSREHKKSANYHSIIKWDSRFSINDWLIYSDLRRECQPSSLEEKKQLITAEVNNGYFHGL